MRFVAFLMRTFAALALCLCAADLCIRAAMPHLVRLTSNFSGAYLYRAITQDDLSKKIVLLGDSVLWGYRLAPEQAAVSILIARGIPAENLSFEGGSLANTYALLRLIESLGIHPKAVVFNINLKEFNPADSAYQTLYPGLEQIVWTRLSKTDQALLKPTQSHTLDASFDRALSRFWMAYGMRSDIRQLLFNDADAASALLAATNRASKEAERAQRDHVPTADKFLGTYDLTALSDANIEVKFLRKVVRLLESDHIPAVAIITPANHALLHDYIDSPDYEAQLRYVSAIVASGGINVVDMDRAFPAVQFLDNDHLTAIGNRRLASLLETKLHDL